MLCQRRSVSLVVSGNCAYSGTIILQIHMWNIAHDIFYSKIMMICTLKKENVGDKGHIIPFTCCSLSREAQFKTKEEFSTQF